MTTLPMAADTAGQAAIESRLRALEQRLDATYPTAPTAPPAGAPTGMTLIVFSDDIDRLLAAFMLANGAAAMGMPVSMFFTFWALAAVRRKTVFAGKRPLERLVTTMLPAGPRHLALSKWDLFGLGRRFFAAWMRRRRIEDVESLMDLSRQLGVRIVACETAMGALAVTRDEIAEGTEFGGVATCLAACPQGTITLFI